MRASWAAAPTCARASSPWRTTACSSWTSCPSSARTCWRCCASRWRTALIHLARANQNVTYPCRVMLVAAMNPCPCGYFNVAEPPLPLQCSTEVHDYHPRVSGPLLDRIDITLETRPVEHHQLARRGPERALGVLPRAGGGRPRAPARPLPRRAGRALQRADDAVRLLRRHCRLSARGDADAAEGRARLRPVRPRPRSHPQARPHPRGPRGPRAHPGRRPPHRHRLPDARPEGVAVHTNTHREATPGRSDASRATSVRGRALPRSPEPPCPPLGWRAQCTAGGAAPRTGPCRGQPRAGLGTREGTGGRAESRQRGR